MNHPSKVILECACCEITWNLACVPHCPLNGFAWKDGNCTFDDESFFDKGQNLLYQKIEGSGLDEWCMHSTLLLNII